MSTSARIASLLAAVLAVLATPALGQQPVQVKLGTLAPNGSTWHEILKEMAERWSQASNGTVKLRIYPGGTQGNEGEMIRKMAVGQLQGAAVTTTGLHDIAPEPQALSVPQLLDGDDEVAALREAFADFPLRLNLIDVNDKIYEAAPGHSAERAREMRDITVPTGMFCRGRLLPGRISAVGPAISLSPTRTPTGAMIRTLGSGG